MINTQVNYLAVLLSAIANTIIGFLWYGPILGKSWIKEMSFSKKDMEKAMKAGMGKTYFAMTITSLILACTLAIILNSIEIKTIINAVLISILLWFGFVTTIMLGSVLWEGKSVKLYLINVSYYLVSLIIMSIIITLL